MLNFRNVVFTTIISLYCGHAVASPGHGDCAIYSSRLSPEENEARQPALTKIAQEFSPDTFYRVSILPEDDELWSIAYFATNVGTDFHRAYTFSRRSNPEKSQEYLAKSLPWLCMASALHSQEAYSILSGLGGSIYFTEDHFETEMIADIKATTLEISKSIYRYDKDIESHRILYNTNTVPPITQEIDRSWDFMKSVTGMRVIPAAEERILKRVNEWKAFRARVRRSSEEETLSISSTHSHESDEPAAAAATSASSADSERVALLVGSSSHAKVD